MRYTLDGRRERTIDNRGFRIRENKEKHLDFTLNIHQDNRKQQVIQLSLLLSGTRAFVIAMKDALRNHLGI